jgi:hypothetical protein
MILTDLTNNAFNIKFHIHESKYKIPESDYPYISHIKIYGFNKINMKRIVIINKNGRIELSHKDYLFTFSTLVINKNLYIRMDSETRIVIN